MASLNQIADSVTGYFSQHGNVVFRERVKFDAKNLRATLIRRDSERNPNSHTYLQKVKIDLEKVNIGKWADMDLDANAMVSKNSIAFPIRLNSNSDFKFVGDLYGGDWVFTEFEEFKFRKHNRFTGDAVVYTFLNNYLYVLCNSKIKYAVLEYVFENPSQAETFCDGTGFKDDMEFPCPADMIDTITSTLIERYKNEPPTDDKEITVNE